MSRYVKTPQYVECSGIYTASSAMDVNICVKHRVPGNIILVHGVNDLGTSYEAMEHGLCEGLTTRLGRGYIPASYRMPTEADAGKLEDEPDFVFFRRAVTEQTHSPVIPFYWGYRERSDRVKKKNGEYTDRHGNRVNKDYAKGGGPFANATTSLPDMWNRGIGLPLAVEELGDDPIRPVRITPGRMYMVLAAKRLAALIAMIRDYDERETVSIVAHSQGCLVSLLAQVFLLQDKQRPADTLILNNPPYSLDDDLGFIWRAARWMDGSDNTDPGMAPHYLYLADSQTLRARLDTLINIVKAVGEEGRSHASSPVFSSLNEPEHDGMVGPTWEASADRDNRGKVYLYFCPQDATVALAGIKGIGWQGVPDSQRGREVDETAFHWDGQLTKKYETAPIERRPLAELGDRFYQRVFSQTARMDARSGVISYEKVGLPRHHYQLRAAGEDDLNHVSPSERKHRENLPENASRDITGEPLKTPVYADLGAASEIKPDDPRLRNADIPAERRGGPMERITPDDASGATAGKNGIRRIWQHHRLDGVDPSPDWRSSRDSPAPRVYKGRVRSGDMETISRRINAGREPAQHYTVHQAFECLDKSSHSRVEGYLVERDELPDEARLRWQQSYAPKSYHSAIVGNKANHVHVTAYDVAIGSGKASSDPRFYAYLCAVADWRFKRGVGKDILSDGRGTWSAFLDEHEMHWGKELESRRILIEGTMNYYNTGVLPALPLLWQAVKAGICVCETTNGRSLVPD
ncbi:T6SS effector phospholipase Tle3 domain-containing protein [Pseudoduganella namucuonensis]|uniref:DUF3274 domain-containing protein n=1 Tax=Pseudoduganella namucuonensis TaxID=1035707 RepID=A0A1I7FWV7_9BURK|nr:DUF3274 domain-containing protein [Pseudoduganella namucuonensis]SFU40631.1 Protein of unknown function [Pseudoduganella namucuonensis]